MTRRYSPFIPVIKCIHTHRGSRRKVKERDFKKYGQELKIRERVSLTVHRNPSFFISTFKSFFHIPKEMNHFQVVYKRRAARPAAAIKPEAAVGPAAIPLEVAVVRAAEVAEETLLEAPEAASDATEEALAPASDATEEADAEMEEAADPALEEIAEADEAASEETLEATLPAPKTVVDPTVVSKVEEPLVTVETMAEVVIAEDEPPSVALGVL